MVVLTALFVPSTIAPVVLAALSPIDDAMSLVPMNLFFYFYPFLFSICQFHPFPVLSRSFSVISFSEFASVKTEN